LRLRSIGDWSSAKWIFGRKNPSTYLETLFRSSAEAQELVHALSITDSEFFRDPLAFALLEQLLEKTVREFLHG
jgi:chemotaxis methyl-accepting protein methylase